MEYLDFELQLGAGRGRSSPVTVVRSPAGEASATMRFPFSAVELKNHLLAIENALLYSDSKRGARRRVLTLNEQPVQNFGRPLFDALFTDEVRNRYEISLAEAGRQGKGLRIKLRIESSALAALPWEFLYDLRRGEYVCLSQRTPLVRYMEVPQPTRPLAVALPLRILGLVASPDDPDLDRLDVEHEKERVEAAVAPLRARGLLELTWLPGQTFRHVQEAMHAGPWHIFHFVGHAGFDTRLDEGVIVLEDEAGRAHRLSATNLSRLLGDHDPLRLVLLNACEGARGSTSDLFSGTASALVRRGAPAVLAMQFEITDTAAIEFARTFYRAVADGIAVDAAVTEARIAISMAPDSVEWGTPVLFMHAPDGVLFNLPRPATEPLRVDDQAAAQREKVNTVVPPPAADSVPGGAGKSPPQQVVAAGLPPVTSTALPHTGSDGQPRRTRSKLWIGLAVLAFFVVVVALADRSPGSVPAPTPALATSTAGFVFAPPLVATPVATSVRTVATPVPPTATFPVPTATVVRATATAVRASPTAPPRVFPTAPIPPLRAINAGTWTYQLVVRSVSPACVGTFAAGQTLQRQLNLAQQAVPTSPLIQAGNLVAIFDATGNYRESVPLTLPIWEFTDRLPSYVATVHQEFFAANRSWSRWEEHYATVNGDCFVISEEPQA